jgi:hypothetical protein
MTAGPPHASPHQLDSASLAAARARLRAEVTRLAAIHKPSASAGEFRAAKVIAQTMRDAGARVRVEPERAHGTYWVPMLALSAAGVAAGLLGRGRGRAARAAGTALGVSAAAGVWDDITGGEHHVRQLLPRRVTHNVIAEYGPQNAARTIVMVAHYDAAKSGLIFHPRIPEVLSPNLLERRDRTREMGSPPVMAPVLAGPALAAAGALTGVSALAAAGAVISAGAAAVFCDIARSKVVPAANDNVSGVVCLQETARRLIADPPPDTRLMFVFTGSEESFMEGMHRFARRHFPALDRDRTFVLCVDTVGSDRLLVLRGEGMLKLYRYPQRALDLMDDVAEELSVELEPNVLLRNATDGLYALKAGYQCAMLGSVSPHGAPANYHWSSDTAENVNYGTIDEAVRVCELAARRVHQL